MGVGAVSAFSDGQSRGDAKAAVWLLISSFGHFVRPFTPIDHVTCVVFIEFIRTDFYFFFATALQFFSLKLLLCSAGRGGKYERFYFESDRWTEFLLPPLSVRPLSS